MLFIQTNEKYKFVVIIATNYIFQFTQGHSNMRFLSQLFGLKQQ